MKSAYKREHEVVTELFT